MRYKNKFSYTVEAEDEVLDLASLKLILQPLVENAIYHGMEFMDGDGEIRIRAWRKDKDLFMSVSDNGLGMTLEQVKRLFGDTDHVPSGRGSIWGRPGLWISTAPFTRGQGMKSTLSVPTRIRGWRK